MKDATSKTYAFAGSKLLLLRSLDAVAMICIDG